MDSDTAFADTRSIDVASELHSAAWWSRLSAEELRDIIKRGFAGGDAFQGAVAEAERRAKEATRQLRDAAAREAERSRKLKLFILWSAVGAAGIIFASAVWF